MRDDSRLYYFGDYIFPIVKGIHHKDKQEVSMTSFLGTGFFIGSQGYFLTANHVLNSNMIQNIKYPEVYMGFLKLFKDEKWKWEPRHIATIEDEPNKLDISVGQLDYSPKKFFNITEESDGWGWEDVHSFGYPNHLQYTDDYSLTRLRRFEGQFLKGYIVRKINLEEKNFNNTYQAGYIVSYPIPYGMSGSPIFKTGSNHPLVSICIRSCELETTLYEDGKEQIGNFEFGYGLSMYALKNWKINIASRKTLEELTYF